MLEILIAPSGFKESLEADEVATCIEAGVLAALPSAHIVKAPLVDGGEGFTKALVGATGGTLHPIEVTGPVGEPVGSHFGFLGGDGPRTAVLEMAAAAGLRLVPRELRDPLETTTYGVGELIAAALDLGAERVLVGCGDSGTNDGGAGMAQALGISLLGADGEHIGLGGRALAGFEAIDATQRHPRLDEVRIDVACNVHNVLCGADGVARVFGPQRAPRPRPWSACPPRSSAGPTSSSATAASTCGRPRAHLRRRGPPPGRARRPGGLPRGRHRRGGRPGPPGPPEDPRGPLRARG